MPYDLRENVRLTNLLPHLISCLAIYVDLGMIREVLIEGGQVEVRMVLTAPGCLLASYLVERVRQAAEGVEKATVTLLDEPWRPEWMARS